MFRRFGQSGLVIILSVIACLSTSLVHAEQKKTFDQFDVHYVAASTAMLTPAIAKIYKIQRSKSRGLVTIAIRNNDEDKAVEGLVRGSVKNSIGQLQALSFTKITDREAIYYLATYNFADKQFMNFDVLVSPMGVQDTYVLNFRQQFFVD